MRTAFIVGAALLLGLPIAHAGVVKKILSAESSGLNLLKPEDWRPWEKGFTVQDGVFVCDNGTDAQVQRGASQTVALNQKTPQPILAVAWSKAENVGGSRDNDYSLYLDLVYTDDEPLWGQVAPFNTGSHDWERREVMILPAKPIKTVSFHLLLRRHTGKASFRNPELREIRTPAGAVTFDGVPVAPQGWPKEGFQVRDVAANSDFVNFEKGQALGLKLESETQEKNGIQFIQCRVTAAPDKDRAVTLIYAKPIGRDGWRWLADPRSEVQTKSPGEYVNASRFNAGANGCLSRYPLAAVAKGDKGLAIALDMGYPAFYRLAYNAGAGEMFIAYDLGLAPERPFADLRFCLYEFDGRRGFRGALQKLYEIFPDYFRNRTPEQGLWMPFAKISKVEGWQDFGFKFKEGHDETEWDDAHNITTFRYTEPMTWWMKMDKEMPRTMDAALAEAKRLADKGNPQALAFLTSGYHDEQGKVPARLLDTPWCNGAVWSMNSSPDIKGDVTDFKHKWNPQLREKLYGPQRKGDLDGEYVDSSEGYVTDELDFRREHFAAQRTPLTFSLDSRKPAVFRGLIAYEYVRALADDVHKMGKLMMANSTPIRLCWLAPWLEVMGTETDWHRKGKWQPMSDAELIYRRALCATKPYCFLMNTNFDEFSHELVEKYMKRSLAYGMFPGFFSADASTKQYFVNPALYNRDRPLFKKYVPLCKLVAEAGWQPVTRARSSDPKVYVERFGENYLTVFNDGAEEKTVTLTREGRVPTGKSRDLVTGAELAWQEAKRPLLDQVFGAPPVAETTLALKPEDVAVIQIDAADRPKP